MGQYFEVFAKLPNESWETINHDWQEFGGLKLMEHSYLDNKLSLFLRHKLANDWKGAKIYHIGDYADMKYPEAKDAYIKMNVDPVRYVVNLEKKLFVDTEKVIEDRYGFKIDPILLLTALGNGRGGGDYHSHFNEHLVGSWAGDMLAATDNIEEYSDYQEYYPLFSEEHIDTEEYNPLSYSDYSYWFGKILKKREV